MESGEFKGTPYGWPVVSEPGLERSKHGFSIVATDEKIKNAMSNCPSPSAPGKSAQTSPPVIAITSTGSLLTDGRSRQFEGACGL